MPVEIFFDVKHVLLIIVAGQLIVWVLGQVILVGQKGPDAAQLQDALAAVHDGQLIPTHKFFAIMSSDEFKKGKKSSPLFEEGLNVTINCWVLSASHSFV